MERESKTIITREWVENELRFYNTADIKYLTLNLFTMGLALGVPPLYLITRQRASTCDLMIYNGKPLVICNASH